VSAVRTDVVESGILRVTLDRPKANAIDVRTSGELYGAFTRLERDPDLRVAILIGAGQRFFSAGWDLKAAASGETADADHGPGGFGGLTELHDRRKPVIAAVNGLALGGGFELALAADLMMAADHVELALPEVTLGLVADSGGMLRLPRRLSPSLATEMLLTGRRLTASEAHAHGLVTAVVPGSDLMSASVALARRICAAAPLAVAAVMEVLQRTAELDVAQGFALLRSGSLPDYAKMLRSADAEEGPRAFVEKRAPRWSGR
jgi:crotonobetainyl-CoA hydratase